jgi:NAD(P)-dependent dehydrogenase (short-subunit alcohol dehydrogenase family)
MRTIVMTGGTSGFGELAARAFARSAENRLILGSRGRVPEGITSLPADVDVLPLDLTSLDEVRTFAAEVSARVDRIDALLLNAGLVRADVDARTVDGFEPTFAVNHLAHYLLLRLLLDRLADGSRVVQTTSGTHDPAERSGFPPPRHADARLLARPERDPDLDRNSSTAARHAYTCSKLCAVLTARALTARPDAGTRGPTAVAYCPGQVGGTGLVRDQGPALRVMWRLLGTPMRRLVPRFNSREAAGRVLADLALGTVRPPAGRVYVALRRGRVTFPDLSELAARDDLAARLWQDSATLVDLQPRDAPD